MDNKSSLNRDALPKAVNRLGKANRPTLGRKPNLAPHQRRAAIVVRPQPPVWASAPDAATAGTKVRYPSARIMTATRLDEMES